MKVQRATETESAAEPLEDGSSGSGAIGHRSLPEPGRWVRERSVPIVIIVALNLAIFGPILIHPHRFISPNAIYYYYYPWAASAIFPPMHDILNDPATAYLTSAAVVKESAAAFHWNPWLAAGVPGYGSLSSAMMTPFALFPALLLPLALFHAGMVFLKLNAAFLSMYVLSRSMRFDRSVAAVSATSYALAGSHVVLWLWQHTAVTALLPLVFVVAQTMFERVRVSVFAVASLVIALLLSGYPGPLAAGGYLAIAFGLYELARRGRVPWKNLLRAVSGVALGVAVLWPMLVSFARFLRRTGYLESRAEGAKVAFYPIEHLWAVLDWTRLVGVNGAWTGNPSLGANDNPVEATLYLGPVILLLVLIGIFTRREGTGFWKGAFVALFVLMFVPALGALAGWLPGMQFTPMTRLRVLVPLAAATLAAAGAERSLAFFRRRELAAIVAGVGILLSVWPLVHWFYPYLNRAEATIPSTPSIEFLRGQELSRVLPIGDVLWPNSAEMYGIEDVRSHFVSEGTYRGLLELVDPEAFDRFGTILTIGEDADLESPVLDFLNVRFLLTRPDRPVESPSWRPVRLFPDGIIYESTDVKARFFASWTPVLVEDPEIQDIEGVEGIPVILREDGRGAAVVAIRAVPELAREASIEFLRKDTADLSVTTDSKVPFLLVTSEKLAPELRVELDGRVVSPMEVNMDFVAIPILQGRHEVVLSRRIGSGRWTLAVVGVLLWMVAGISEVRPSRLFHG